MSTYKVTVTRTLETVVEVEAENRFEAIDQAKDIYKTEVLTLGTDDWSSTIFSAEGPVI
jgi:hypothetical protein